VRRRDHRLKEEEEEDVGEEERLSFLMRLRGVGLL